MVQQLSEIPRGESITGCFYGGAGTGKTGILATPDNDRWLYCNVEDRLGTFQSPWCRSKFPKWNPYIITVNEAPLPDTALALDSLKRQIDEFVDKNLDKIDGIMLDGTTALRRFTLNKALELQGKVGKSKTHDKLKAINMSSEIQFIDVLPGDIGAEMRMIETFIIEMKDWAAANKKHFFMTAHERIEYNPPPQIGGEKTVRSIKPGFSGQTFPDSVPGLFDFVWRTISQGAEDQTKYYAITSASQSEIAKTTGFTVKQVKIQNPSIPKIIKAFKEGTPYGE